jgi:hypothetical protein
MQPIEKEVAARGGLDEREAVEAIDTVREATAADHPVRAEELYYRLGRRLGVAPARAIEIAQIACHAIAAALPPDERRRSLARLPADVRALFAAPASVAAPAGRGAGLAGARQTLAEGRPGSTHPLSEARPGSEHPVSEGQAPTRRVR